MLTLKDSMLLLFLPITMKLLPKDDENDYNCQFSKKTAEERGTNPSLHGKVYQWPWFTAEPQKRVSLV